MAVSPARIDAITLFVEDLERSRAFYDAVFGLPVHFADANSVVFKFEHLLINLLKRAAAPELIAPAAVAGRNAGAQAQFTIGVDDVDAMCAELAKGGVSLLNGPVNRRWGPRTASFADPDGHVWEIAGPPGH